VTSHETAATSGPDVLDGIGRAVYVASVDWAFLSHRLELARALSARGCDIWVVAPDTGRLAEIEAEGFTAVPARWTRWGTRPTELVRAVAFLTRLYWRIRPDLVHHVAPKPVILGSLAARMFRRLAVVNTLTGFGHSRGHDASRWHEAPLNSLYRIGLRNRRAITAFQNPQDLNEALQIGLLPRERAKLILGSGVDPKTFFPACETANPPLVLFASRLIRQKGVTEFVAAARIVRSRCPDVRFALVGAPDEGNADSITRRELDSWAREGVVEWWGHRRDMPGVLAQASIVALPTRYREGLPKVLLEAAALGRPIVASDIAGCRPIVRDGLNGLRVPPQDPLSLARALLRLLEDPNLRRQMGSAGRQLVMSEFTNDRIIEQTFGVYRESLRSVQDSSVTAPGTSGG